MKVVKIICEIINQLNVHMIIPLRRGITLEMDTKSTSL